MRTLKDLNLATREFMVEDRRRSWRLFLSTWALLLAALALTAVPASWPLRCAASVAAGLLILRMFMFYHDTLHDAIFRDSRLAKAILWVYGILILNPANVWKRSHNYHHQHNAQMATASIGSFPVMTVGQFQRATFWKRVLYRLARHPLTILLGYVTIFLIGMCLKSFLTDWRRHWDSALALVLHFAIAMGLYRAGGAELLLFSFLLPMFLSTAIGGYLFYIQHNFPDVEMRPREEWDYVFAALRSSSFMTGNRLVHWITGNIGYHHVHHLNARIPFYRLPEAMAAIPELQTPMTTSLRPREIRRCLRLKLWDPPSGRMVGFPKVSPRVAFDPTHSPTG